MANQDSNHVDPAHVDWVLNLLEHHFLPGYIDTPLRSSTQKLAVSEFYDLLELADQYIDDKEARSAGLAQVTSEAMAPIIDACRILFSIKDACLFMFGPDGYYARHLPITSRIHQGEPGQLSFRFLTPGGGPLPNSLLMYLRGQLEVLPELLGIESTNTTCTEQGTLELQFDPQQGLLLNRDQAFRETAGRLAQDVLRNHMTQHSGMVGDGADSNDGLEEPRSLQSQLLAVGELLTDTTGEATFIIDHDGHVQFANTKAGNLFGYNNADLATHDITDLLPLLKPRELLVGKEQSNPGQLYMMNGLHHDRSLIPLEVRTRHLPIGETDYLACTIRDQSSAAESSARIESLDHQLRESQKQDTLGRLSMEVVHDFNNLLIAIDGYAELAQNDPDSTSIGTWLEEIRSASLKGTQLTRRLLDFARKDRHQPRLLEINRLLFDTSHLIKRLIPDNVTSTCTTLPEETLVLGDPSQLEQVIVNLAVNARDAMPGGGRLDINATIDDGDAEPRVMIKVTDTGTGMNETVRARIFEPLFTTKPKSEGTGLGLSIVKRIVEDHEGSLDVDSEEGRGTTFLVSLPIAKAAGPAQVGRTHGKAIKQNNYSILVIEDDERVLELIRLMLRARGHEVTICQDSDDAAPLLAGGSSFELAIIDLLLPGQGGLEFANALARKSPNTRILLVSGYGDNHPLVMEASRQFDVLTKPFSADLLIDTIFDVMHQPRARADA